MLPERRPNPDELLRRVQAAERRQTERRCGGITMRQIHYFCRKSPFIDFVLQYFSIFLKFAQIISGIIFCPGVNCGSIHIKSCLHPVFVGRAFSGE